MQEGTYQAFTQSTDLMQGNIVYHILGLFSEAGELTALLDSANEQERRILLLLTQAGEIAAQYKRMMRDQGKDTQIVVKDSAHLPNEIGDCQWYIARLAADIGFTLEEIQELNTRKLTSRKKRGVIQGKGDDR